MTGEAVSGVRLLDAGETALVVELGTTVDPAIHDRILALDEALNAELPPGLIETVPTFRSLMVHYDPLVLARDALAAIAERLLARSATGRAAARTPAIWRIPCCYDPTCAEDLAEAAARLGLKADEAAERHAGATYRVYMYGFAPGHCYLGGLPEALAISRRETPRPPHAAGAVTIGGGMSLISTLSMPTGWWVIGRTPERMLDLGRTPSAFAAVGDLIRFEAIDRATFDALESRAASGEMVAHRMASA